MGAAPRYHDHEQHRPACPGRAAARRDTTRQSKPADPAHHAAQQPLLRHQPGEVGGQRESLSDWRGPRGRGDRPQHHHPHEHARSCTRTAPKPSPGSSTRTTSRAHGTYGIMGKNGRPGHTRSTSTSRRATSRTTCLRAGRPRSTRSQTRFRRRSVERIVRRSRRERLPIENIAACSTAQAQAAVPGADIGTVNVAIAGVAPLRPPRHPGRLRSAAVDERRRRAARPEDPTRWRRWRGCDGRWQRVRRRGWIDHSVTAGPGVTKSSWMRRTFRPSTIVGTRWARMP